LGDAPYFLLPPGLILPPPLAMGVFGTMPACLRALGGAGRSGASWIHGNQRKYTHICILYIYGYIIYIILNSSYEIIRISMKVIWKYAEIWVGFMYVCVHIYEIDSRKVGNLEHYGGNIIDSSHPGNTKNYLFVGYYG